MAPPRTRPGCATSRRSCSRTNSSSWTNPARLAGLAVQQSLFHVRNSCQLLVPPPALKLIDADCLQRLPRRQPACCLLVTALLEPARQAVGTTERIGLELADHAVRPARRDLVNRQIRTVFGVAVDGVGSHRHGKSKAQSRKFKGASLRGSVQSRSQATYRLL